MTYFRYKGRDRSGKAKRGKVNADSQQDALLSLKETGIVVFEIEELNPILYKDIHIGKVINNRDFVTFLRQFATLIDAGIPLIETTNILEDQVENKFLKKALGQVQEQLEEGIPLSEAFASYPKLFPELLVSMVHAGEVSGTLDEILDNMATYYEKQYQLKQKIISALTYPLAVGIIAVFITIFLLAFIVPIFTDMLTSFGEEIPLYTAIVLQISEVVQTYWWLLLLIVSVMAIVYKYLEQKEDTAYTIDLLKLRIPIFGKFIQKSLLARMTQTLSSLLNSSVPILQAVEITSRVIPNRVIKRILSKSKDSLEEGESLAAPMKEHWVIPKLVTQMIAVGEKTGSMDGMLKKVADFYEQDMDEAADKLKSLIEPVMVVFLAVVVGAIVMAVIIPMFSVFESI